MMAIDSGDYLMTREEAMRFYGQTSPGAFYVFAKRAGIPVAKVGKRGIRFPRKAGERWLAARMGQAG